MAPSLPFGLALAKRFRSVWRHWHAQHKGRAAEYVALIWLLAKGYRPFQRPYHTLAQTDLLLLQGTTLVLVEVKARSSQHKAHLALSPQQKQRLIKQAAALAARHPHLTTRLDLVLFFPHPPFAQHLRNLNID